MSHKPSQADTEYRTLQDALDDLDQLTPCQQEPELWFSDDRAERARAADACLDCPLFGPCGAYADAARERFGTWAGIDRQAPLANRRNAA
ncbi:hypothetical protein GCM10027586_06250 [Kineococcus gypseus]|uniref:WhiB family transcriptional regulator n=1 Tax=Kineococcus gypseus TaxID=1637102 RepID=UPI003D7D87A0